MNWLKKFFGAVPHRADQAPPVVPAPATVRPKAQGIPAIVHILQYGSCDFDVVGESSYQRELQEIVGGTNDDGHQVEVTVWLICENGNPHDRNAVAVVVNEKTVAYLSREDARDYRKSLREETGSIPSAMTKGMIVGGGLKKKTGERMHLGIRIDLSIPIELE